MTQPNQRQRFRTLGDWHNFLQQLQASNQNFNPYELRSAVYRDIESYRGRPLIVYAAKFPLPQGSAPNIPISIDLADVDGFADLIANASKSENVDVLVHSPGGSPEATERIVGLLRSKFRKVSFLIPHSAYSAATMLSLSGDEVLMHPSAVLGPIDPQLNSIPARSIKRGFENVRDVLKSEGPEALPAYLPMIEQYSLHLLELCDDSLNLSRALVEDWLKRFMFGGDETKSDIVANAVEFFSNYDHHLTHSRPLTFDRLADLKLNIYLPDDKLQELIREAYILLNGLFNISPFVKIFENGHGLSWGNQFQMVQTFVNPQPPTP